MECGFTELGWGAGRPAHFCPLGLSPFLLEGQRAGLSTDVRINKIQGEVGKWWRELQKVTAVCK